MKASDVVAQLTSEVHKYTDLFSDFVNIVNVSRTGGFATVETEQPHLLNPGQGFYITNVNVPINITTLTRSGAIGTLVTTDDHDLTLSVALEITIADAIDAEFNGVFKVRDVPNRRTIKFTMADAGPTTSTGAKLLSAVRYDQEFNGFHKVISVPGPNTVVYADPSIFDVEATGGKLRTNLRVSSTANMQRVEQAFTKQEPGKFYLFVVLGDVGVVTLGGTQQDVTGAIGRGDNYRQVIKETVGLFVIGSTKDEIGGRIARDLMSDLLPALTKSIAFYRFPASFYVGTSNPLVFVSHSMRLYDGAIYVHDFMFEATTEMVINDTVGYPRSVAFRGIDLTQYPDLDGTGFMNTFINLDTEAL